MFTFSLIDRKPLSINYPVNENPPNWFHYRLTKDRMRSLSDVSTHWRATCSYDKYGINNYKITSVEKLQILTSLPTLMVNAFRPSLSTSVVTLGYTRLRGIIPQVVTFLTSKVLQVDASFLFQV